MPLIDGTFEPHGIAWSAANSDYRDWTRLGSGYELLINTLATGDQIKDLVPMGLDAMAVMLRNSIWLITRTGQVTRPGDARVREPKTGAVNGRVSVATRHGVIYLSDSGVYSFDGNRSTIISDQINGDLLPLDYDNLDHYHASYNPMTDQYILHEPTGGSIWVYDMHHQRWTKRAGSQQDSALWLEQIAHITWNDAVGTWNTSALSWYDFLGTSDEVQILTLGTNTQSELTSLEFETRTSTRRHGTLLSPYWQLPKVPDVEIDRWLLQRRFIIKYVNSGILELVQEEPTSWLSKTLVLTSDLQVATYRKNYMSLSMGPKLVWDLSDGGDLELANIQIVYIPKGLRNVPG
jgi:hypothetical protein